MLSLRIIRNAKRNIYDDLLEVVVDGIVVKSLKCNSQPAGNDPLSYGRGMIATGAWTYRTGIHGLSKPANRRYRAFVQAKPIRVVRANGKGGWLSESVCDYSFNIHHGGFSSVSSLGCITIHPDKWVDFKDFVYKTLDDADQATFQVVIRNEGEESPAPKDAVIVLSPFQYLIARPGNAPFDHINEVKFHLGHGVVQVRATIAKILRVEPSSLEFKWNTVDNEDQLTYNGMVIQDIDVSGQEGVTWGYIGDIVKAIGWTYVKDGKSIIISKGSP